MENSQSLPKKIINVWFLSELLGLIVAIIIIIAGFYIINIFFSIKLIYCLALVGLSILVTIFRFILIPYYYRFWKYQINDQFVYIQSGFFFKSQKTIPINRIQNVDLEQGPLLRLNNLKKININTAAKSFSIDGITNNEATILRNQIVRSARKARELND